VSTFWGTDQRWSVFVYQKNDIIKNMFYFYVLGFFWFVVFIKTFLFWLWLWQLKEYHIGRFRAHFEAQKIKKVISSFWRLKYPKFTKKIIVILFTGAGLAILWLFYLPGFLLIILAPVFSSLLVLFFQIPTVIWRNNVLQKAKLKRAQFNDLLVIGITGSYGKTSFKEFLAAILAEKFNVLKSRENQNSEIGISQCILRELKPEHEIFICEMAAYNKGGIKLLCDIVKPKIGIITGVNEQHLATFGSMENLLSAEGGKELIESLPCSQPRAVLRGLPKDGIAFFNAKNRYCQDLYQKTKTKKFLYGENIKTAGLENIEGAKLVARELGMNEQEIEQAAAKIKDKFPGIEIKKSISGLTVINATYSANPTGVMAHLDYLKTLRQADGKLMIVMPCLIELGPASERIHQEIGKKIGETCDLALIITKDRFREIKQGAPSALFMENPKEILEKIKSFTKEDDIVLLEGRMPKQLIALIEKL